VKILGISAHYHVVGSELARIAHEAGRRIEELDDKVSGPLTTLRQAALSARSRPDWRNQAGFARSDRRAVCLLRAENRACAQICIHSDLRKQIRHRERGIWKRRMT
jgi:hypothetical protein